MGMQTEMPDGRVLTEFFKDMTDLKRRQKELQDQGGKTLRIIEMHSNPKYPTPHQGKKEVERRRRQMEQLLAKAAAQ